MAPVETRAEQLVRIVGTERSGHPAEAVAAAEEELMRRLGGHLAEARARLRHAGLFGAVLGLSVLAAAGTVVFAWASTSPWASLTSVAPAARAVLWVGLVALCGMGVLFLAAGAAVLASEPRTLKRRRLIPFVHAEDLAVLTTDPPTEALLEAVGAARSTQAPGAVPAAETELRRRLADAAQKAGEGVQQWGHTAVMFGVLLGFVGALSIVFMIRSRYAEASIAPGSASTASSAHLAALWAMSILTALAGVSIAVCGDGLRKRKPWAADGLVRTLWVYLGTLVGLSLLACILAVVDRGVEGATLVAFPLTAALWAAVVSRIARPFSLPEVREACGAPVSPLAQGPAPAAAQGEERHT